MKFKLPVKVVAASENITNIEALFIENPLQIELNPNKTVNFNGKGYIILDFGEESSGGIRIFTSYIADNSKVRIRFGESVGEACSEIGEKGSTNDHSTRDMVVHIPTLSDQTFGQTGFRFVRIDFMGEWWKLRNIMLADDSDEREEVGSFECNDELVNNIWKTASHTMRLNLHNGLFWDGVKRDRLCWIGDAYPEMKAALCLYKDIPEIVNTLNFTWDTTEPGKDMNGIINYNIWWLYILAEHYFYDGNTQYLSFQKENVLLTLEKLNELVAEDGTLNFPNYFIDWPSYYTGGDDEESLTKEREGIAGTSFLLTLALNKLANAYAEIGSRSVVNLSNEILDKLLRQSYEVEKYKQIAALGVLAGDPESDQLLEVILNGGAKGMSTFMSYFILSALAKQGKYNDALSMMKKYYGGMLSVGATSFWEDFDIEWLNRASRIDEMPKDIKKDIHGDYGKFCYSGYRHSLCHGWSSGVIPYIVENIVGLKPVDSNTYSFHPHMSGLNYIKCTVPTAHGIIIVELTKQDNHIIKNIKHSKDINILVD